MQELFRLGNGLWVSAESNRNNVERFKTSRQAHFFRRQLVLLNILRGANSGQIVAMVRATESRHGYDPAGCIGNLHFFTTCRRSLP
jgi:hypothetical protein